MLEEPLGQPVLTTGVSRPISSTSTLPKASEREETATHWQRFYKWKRRHVQGDV
jgi:hypothetical protein